MPSSRVECLQERALLRPGVGKRVDRETEVNAHPASALAAGDRAEAGGDRGWVVAPPPALLIDIDRLLEIGAQGYVPSRLPVVGLRRGWDPQVWHVDQPVPVEDLDWSDVSVVERGTTEIGLAISAVTDAIRDAAQHGHGLPPALVLISDGKPTDLATPTFGAALRELAEHPWGAKASRIAIGIGADADMDALQRFVGHDEIPALRADSAMELSHYLRWASTVVMDEGSRPVTDWSDGPALGSDTTVIDGPGSTVKVTSDAPPPTGPARHDLAPPPLVAPPPATDDATRPGPAW